MKTLIIFVLTLTVRHSLGQEQHKKPTIPLNKTIEIKITDIDTVSFGRYILYKFQYKSTNAAFWAARDDKTFKTGQSSVELCRIIQMKDCIDNQDINMRGCAFYNGLTIFAGDSIIKRYDFSEYSKSPTLRLCTTDK